MVSLIPDSHRYLLDDPIYVVATTVMKDGQPQSSVVWWDSEGEYIRINTTTARQKARNLGRNPKITILALNPKDPYHWMEVRGVVESTSEEGGRDHIETLSWKYTGQKYYGGYTQRNPADETRMIVSIRPVKVLVYPSHK
jgi:PPOX class probable F420-dependent enzyme